MPAPALPALLAGGWSLAAPLDALLLASGCLYAVGVSRARSGWHWRRTAAFLAGLGAIALATQSGLGAYDDRLLSAHMIQHLLVLLVAPLLILEGRPLILLLRSLPPRRRRRLARVVAASRPATGALPCLAAYSLIVLVLHVPAVFDAAVLHPAWHQLEHGLLLLAGLLLWWPVLDGDPVPSHRLSGLARLGYVIAAMVPMALVGAWLAHAAGIAYPVYRAPARALGVSGVADQQTAGALMWVAGNVLMALVGLWVSFSTLLAEERRQRVLDGVAARRSGGREAELGL